MREEGVHIYGTPGVPNNFPNLFQFPYKLLTFKLA